MHGRLWRSVPYLTGENDEQKSGCKEIHEKRTVQNTKGKEGGQKSQKGRENASAIKAILVEERRSTKAFMASSRSILQLVDHPMTWHENRSSTAAS
jgi:hypothetical protein